MTIDSAVADRPVPAHQGHAAAAASDALAVRDVTVKFTTERGTVMALSDVSLEFASGSFTTILGPSGCGKSTLLRVASGLIEPAAGEVSVFGSSPQEARRRRDIGFVFQKPTLLPWLNVVDNVNLPLNIGKTADRKSQWTAKDLLELVGLSGWDTALPHELSGGMRQRVAIARALLDSPRLLLMDEPFGALDEITRDRLNEELLEIWQRTGTTILFVTHSIYEAAFLGERVLLMKANPGGVKEIVDNSARTARTVAERETPEFAQTVSHLRQILRTC